MKIPNVGVRVTLPGESYELWFRRLVTPQVITLKVKTGFTVLTLANGLDEFDPNALQALVWFCRYINGVPQSEVENTHFELGDLDLETLKPDPAPDPQMPKTPESGEPATSESSATSLVSDPTPSTD